MGRQGHVMVGTKLLRVMGPAAMILDVWNVANELNSVRNMSFEERCRLVEANGGPPCAE